MYVPRTAPAGLMWPISDALRMKVKLLNGKLFGYKKSMDLDIIKGVPVSASPEIVDSVFDMEWGVVGLIMKVIGNLYIALIYNDRDGLITIFTVDGSLAGFTTKYDQNGRLKVMGNWQNKWSRKKFYAAIAPGVKATFSRIVTEDDWTLENVGPEKALAYVKKREKESAKRVQTADEINKQNAQKRLQYLSGTKH